LHLDVSIAIIFLKKNFINIILGVEYEKE